jgi:hypothetical protein
VPFPTNGYSLSRTVYPPRPAGYVGPSNVHPMFEGEPDGCCFNAEDLLETDPYVPPVSFFYCFYIFLTLISSRLRLSQTAALLLVPRKRSMRLKNRPQRAMRASLVLSRRSRSTFRFRRPHRQRLLLRLLQRRPSLRPSRPSLVHLLRKSFLLGAKMRYDIFLN